MAEKKIVVIMKLADSSTQQIRSYHGGPDPARNATDCDLNLTLKWFINDRQNESGLRSDFHSPWLLRVKYTLLTNKKGLC